MRRYNRPIWADTPCAPRNWWTASPRRNPSPWIMICQPGASRFPQGKGPTATVPPCPPRPRRDPAPEGSPFSTTKEKERTPATRDSWEPEDPFRERIISATAPPTTGSEARSPWKEATEKDFRGPRRLTSSSTPTFISPTMKPATTALGKTREATPLPPSTATSPRTSVPPKFSWDRWPTAPTPPIRTTPTPNPRRTTSGTTSLGRGGSSQSSAATIPWTGRRTGGSGRPSTSMMRPRQSS
mmetsp:Transcript_32602/g.75024  ORF Transcript_32602/g.75024 Transcript_32602/m.75024 type:complete len:241 (+) Transcript_32602:112-834(+)